MLSHWRRTFRLVAAAGNGRRLRGRWRIGWGMASTLYPAIRQACKVRVKLAADASLQVQCGTQDMGSGTYTALGQMAGLIGGIGMALHETTVTDRASGRILGDSFADYLIPVHADIPEFNIAMVDEEDKHLPGSVRGIGMLRQEFRLPSPTRCFTRLANEFVVCPSELKM